MKLKNARGWREWRNRKVGVLYLLMIIRRRCAYLWKAMSGRIMEIQNVLKELTTTMKRSMDRKLMHLRKIES